MNKEIENYLYYVDMMTSAGMMLMANTKNYELNRELYTIMVENMQEIYSSI